VAPMPQRAEYLAMCRKITGQAEVIVINCCVNPPGGGAISPGDAGA
jgi:hypothetical protein